MCAKILRVKYLGDFTMENSLKKNLMRGFWIYLALYFGLFLLFYIPNYVIEDYAYYVGNFEYIRFFFSRLFEFLISTTAAVVLFTVLVKCGALTRRAVITSALLFASAKAIYALPYYYLYFLSIGYDSIDGIPLYTLSMLLSVIFEWAKIILFFSLCYFVSRRHIVKEVLLDFPVAQRKNPPEKVKAEIKKRSDTRLSELILEGSVLNFDAPVVLGVFLVSVGQFFFSLIEEIKSAVDYLTEYAGNYRTDEIVYMTWCFVFLVIELAASHLIAYYLKNFISKKLTHNMENAK